MPSYGPQLEVGQIVQVVSWCQQSDQAGLNVFHYRVDSIAGGTANPMSVIIAALSVAGHGAALKALINQNAELKGYLVGVVAPSPSVTQVDLTDAGAGTVASDALPRQVAGFFRKKADVPGRRKSGRVYVPFPGEGDNTPDSVPSAGYVTRVGTLANTMLSALTWGAGLGIARPVVYNRGAYLSSSDWSTYLTASKWATQRRRGSFGRINVFPG